MGERKYEDIARKHNNLELGLARANERADNEEKKIRELEEELKVVGNNLQQLEVSEEKAMAREENYQKQIRELFNRCDTSQPRNKNKHFSKFFLQIKSS